MWFMELLGAQSGHYAYTDLPAEGNGCRTGLYRLRRMRTAKPGVNRSSNQELVTAILTPSREHIPEREAGRFTQKKIRTVAMAVIGAPNALMPPGKPGLSIYVALSRLRMLTDTSYRLSRR